MFSMTKFAEPTEQTVFHPSLSSKAVIEALADVQFVLSDIDDTITTDGELPWQTLYAMEMLRDVGVRVILVTGRPAGWCDMVARFFPVAGVIGENGALYYSKDRDNRRILRLYDQSAEDGLQNRENLRATADALIAAHGGLRIASDQAFRLFDVAVDYAEDGVLDEPATLDEILAAFDDIGATAKVSSIHVNAWFGAFSKESMILRVIRDVLALDEKEAQTKLCYVGDSPNDEPAFRLLRNSIGVSNIEEHYSRLQNPPAVVLQRPSALGFLDLCSYIHALKGGP